ncbi:uncharacterized protein LOC134699463 [Mytilus trossulus]|uniref:uncharacterized protein LOC134699463 n=1 Tax=Mytilus trossulus TaxID=6551 RepID=UPI003005213B
MVSFVGMLTTVIFLLFSIRTIRSSAGSNNANRISRLEKFVETQNAEIILLRNEVAEVRVLKNKVKFLEKQNSDLMFFKENVKTHRAEMRDMKEEVRRQKLKTQHLETQLRIIQLHFKDTGHSTTIPNQGKTFENKINKETHRKEVDIDTFRKDPEVALRKQDRMLLTSPVVDTSQKIAFYAYLTKTEVDPGHHHTIIFDTEITNSGNGYNKHTGTFLIPAEGIYVFSFTIVSYHGHRVPTELVVNSNVVGSVTADSYSSSLYPVASTIVIVNLKQGDACFLRTAPDQSYDIGDIWSSGWSRSSFSGWKL